ncbi:MAG: hypothetical protein U9R79_14140 [Armatimonadota bacterium]|nr:hypothetical protein [Armatimonadota bacterium]
MLRAVAVTAVIALAAWAVAAEDAVTVSVSGPTEGHLGAYRNHEGHPTRRYEASLNTGATRYRFNHWVDVHPDHRPKVLPLEGMIGMTAPTGANWYGNGFLNIHLEGEQVGTVRVRAVREMESGARGSVDFEWRRPEGTWRVRFLALPQGVRLFCSVRYFPAGPPADWRLRLVCYPGRQTRDGHRMTTTAARTLEQTSTVELRRAGEWWLAIYDSVYDADHGHSDGGTAMIYAPEDVSAAKLEVTDYPVTVWLTPSGQQVRLIFWGSFFGSSNAEIVEEMQRTAEQHLEALRGTRFIHRAVFADDWRERQAEIDRLLEALGHPADPGQRAREVQREIAEIVSRLRERPGEAGPDDEPRLLDLLQRQEAVLWDMRWEELLGG